MTIAFEAGYVLPGGDLPLNHARILHAGNQFKIKTVTASAEVADYPGSAANIGDTVDRWKPYANLITDPATFDAATWTATNVTVGADSQTVAETTASGNHAVTQAYTFTAVQHVVAFKIERQTMGEVQIRVSDGSTVYSCYFDLRDLTVGTAANCTGQIIAQGPHEYLCSIYFTPAAGTGFIGLYGSNGSEAISYTGAVANTIKVLQASVHLSAATLRMDGFGAQAGDVFCVAAHNLGSSGGRVQFEHDSNNDDTWTVIGSVTPTDDSPIMFLHEGITSSRWRIIVDRGALPEIGVMRIGAALQMERPFYGGFGPTRMARQTEVTGNISGSGELLGRSRRRTILKSSYSWANLSYDWVRTNLDTPTGLIQSAEIDPLFVAWRSSVTQDVDYVMRASAQPPTNTGQRDLMTFSMSGEVHSYE